MSLDNVLPEGTVLKGKAYSYRIERSLDQGSFGITYLASVRMVGALGAIDANIKVAIKEFFMRDINGRLGTTVTIGSRSDLYCDYKRKFEREATNLSKLNHPNIIKVLELFGQNDTIYYSMEYIDGGSLDDYIQNKIMLSEGEAVQAIVQIGDAISFMHSKGMLHLDLKPKNIMRKSDGSYVLIDFGLSKQYDDNGNPESSTTIGAGTLGYSPIEQACYHESKDFPVTMDVYALGGTLFKMLTGRKPPEASIILNNGFPYNEFDECGVSTGLRDCVANAMAPRKKDRYQTIYEFISSLLSINIQDDKTVSANRQSFSTTKRTATTTTSNEVKKIVIQYSCGYIRLYKYILTITINEMSLFMPYVGVFGCESNILKSRLTDGLWENLITRIYEDIPRKEEFPYNKFEDSETPPSFEITSYDKNDEKIDRLYVTGWRADRGNIANMTPYFLNEQIHRLIPSLCDMEKKLRSNNNDDTSLPTPSIVNITEENWGKGYGFSVDIAIWGKKLLVKAFTLLSGERKDIVEKEFPIDSDAFETRLKKYKFLEDRHWEKDYNDTLLLDERVDVDCELIEYYDGIRTVYYYRKETSKGNNPLAIAVHNLLSPEHELNRFLAKIYSSHEGTVIDLNGLKTNINHAGSTDDGQFTMNDLTNYGISIFTFTKDSKLQIYYRGRIYKDECGWLQHNLYYISDVEGVLNYIKHHFPFTNSRQINFTDYIKSNKKLLADSYSIITYINDLDYFSIIRQQKKNPFLFGARRIVKEMQLIPLCFDCDEDNICCYEYQGVYCEAEFGGGIVEILRTGFIKERQSYLNPETKSYKLSNIDGFWFLMLGSVILYKIIRHEWKEDCVLLSTIPFDIKTNIKETNSEETNIRVGNLVNKTWLVIEAGTTIPAIISIGKINIYDGNYTLRIEICEIFFTADLVYWFGYAPKLISLTIDIDANLDIKFIIKDRVTGNEIKLSLLDFEEKSKNEGTIW